MRVRSSGSSLNDRRIVFDSNSQERVIRRAKQATSILSATWRRVLAPGPRSGRWYTHHGRRYQASAPGEVPQAVTQLLRNTGRAGYTVVKTSRGWQARVWFGSPVPYLPRLIRLRRTVFEPVVAAASAELKATAWPR